MNKPLPTTIMKILMVCTLLLAVSMHGAGQSFHQGIRKGTVKIRFAEGMTKSLTQMRVQSGTRLNTGLEAVDAVAQQTTAKDMYRLFPYDAAHEAKLRKHGLHLWYVVEIDENTDPRQAAAIYKKVAGITAAEADHEKILSPYKVAEYKGGVSPMGVMPFNDPYLPSQWHYDNTGQTGYAPGADINLFDAWHSTTGSRDVIVSIHDQGVDVKHNDLAANIWVNTAELNGKPNVDDDHNGYVDDINGWNFDTNNGVIDAQFHGTHVAGTIAAVNNNGIGVSGVAGGSGNNDGTRIMSLQVLAGGSIENSYIYAANNGAVISQNSWGYINPGSFDQSVLDAIDYFIVEAGDYPGSPMKGGIVIFASGNANLDELWYPGYHPAVVAVNSMGPDFVRAPYSNFGAWTDITAPGGNMELGSANGVLSTLPNNKVGYLEGTSMACPHVSGIAALALANRTHQFTAEELRVKLLSGFVSIDEQNPDFIGKLGVGLIDATLAIQNDQHLPPAAITQLKVSATAQEFATLQWTVPQDTDDGKPVKFQIYYHTSPITDANLSQAEKIEIANTANVGEIVDAEVTALKGITTYSFAVVSLDRWGNASALSNVVSTTTNSGPSIDVDAASKAISLTVNAANSTQGQHNITILNNAEGLLRWSYFTRNKDQQLSWSSAAIRYPQLKKTKTGNINLAQRTAVGRRPGNIVAPMSFQTIEKGYGDYWPVTLIGETDSTLTNSSATRFNVTEDEGFNLTHVYMWLKHNKKKGPVVLEVYKGTSIKAKNRMFAQEFNAPTLDENNFTIRLDEQLYFEKGETFWIVFHVPAGHIYPLGISPALDNANALNCLMSFDLGNTWTSLPDLLHDNRYVWTTTAASQNAHLGTYVTLEPASGEVEGNSTAATTLMIDASTLTNGSYQANVVLQSNDSHTPELRIPVDLTVSGQKAKLESIDIVDYGNVFFGKSKEVTIVINNTGYGNFNEPLISISDPQFEIIGSVPGQIAARDKAEIVVRYTPSAFGNVNASLTLSAGAVSHSIVLFGVGIEAGKIEITPVAQTINNIKLKTSVNATFNVKNTGAYALKYFIPGFDDKGISNTWSDPYHKYGYTVHTSLPSDSEPVTYEWQEISSTGTDITSAFKNVDNHYFALDLGFEFPFYTHAMKKVYINPKGVLTFDNSVNMVNQPRLNDSWGPIALISGAGMYFQYDNTGKIFYQQESDRLIVQYDHMREDPTYGYYTFQIVLFDNGNIRMYYKDISTNDPSSIRYMSLLVEDPEKTDGILIGNYENPVGITDGFAIGINSPGPDVIESVQNASGILLPGQSADVAVKMTTTSMTEGIFRKSVNVISNDPFVSSSSASITLNINSGGKAQAVRSTTAINFGNVFQGAVRKDMFLIKNEGTAPVIITSVALQNDKFILTGKSSVTIAPNHAEKFEVSIPTDVLGTRNDLVIITYSTGAVHRISLAGKIVPAPAITVDLSPISETLNHGEKASHPFTIKNSGQGPLEVAITGSEWAYTDLGEVTVSPSSIPDFTYAWRSSKEEGGPSYQWQEIKGKSTKINDLDFDPFDDDKFWKKIALPWSFSFYGQSYDTMYIGYNGIISFTGGQPASFWSTFIPTESAPNNFIAPLWARGGYDSYYNPEISGVYYTMDDEKIIVSFERLINIFGMGDPISVQAVLFKNGSIKFQYRAEGSLEANSQNATVGIEDGTGLNGVQIAAFQNLYVGEGLAIVLSPARKRTLTPGQHLDGNLVVDATTLFGGDYSSWIHINTNVPGQESLDKPVSLTVVGQPALILPDTLGFGEVMQYEQQFDGYTSPASYEQAFTFTNEGSANVNMQSIYVASGNSEITMQVLAQGFWGPEWTPIEWLSQLPIVKPGETLQAKVVITPVNNSGVVLDSIMIVSDVTTYGIVITANVILPPVLNIDTTPITETFVLSTETGTHTVALDNVDGKSLLRYEASIDFKRTATLAASSSEKLTTGKNEKLTKTTPSGVTPMGTQEETFNRVIAYDDQPTPDTYLGYNGASDFTSAMRFNAGPDGFNLTHVQTWFRSEALTSGTLEVEIRAGGTNVVEAVSMLNTTATFNATSPGANGSLFTIELPTSQKILPNEDFYVIITYPMAIGFPQGSFTNAELSEGRHLLYSEGLWYDLQSDPNFETYGWMMRAAEKTFEPSGWVYANVGDNATLEAGASGEFDLHFVPSLAKQGDQKADLVIHSNDPYHSVVRIPVKLHMNDAPAFTGIPSVVRQVNEKEELNLVLRLNDPEGNAFTFRTLENYPRFTATLNGNDVTIRYSPDYTDAGQHSFVLEAKDEHDAVRQVTLTVSVLNVNRAPQFVATNDQLVYDGRGILDEKDLSAFFVDPDNDFLSYTVTNSNPEVAEVFSSSSHFIVKPIMPGETRLAFTVTDLYGATVQDTLTVTVNNIMGIDEHTEKGIAVYPNPMKTKATLTLSDDWHGTVAFEILDATGKIQRTSAAEATDSREVILDVSALQPGVYILRAASREKRAILKLIKE